MEAVNGEVAIKMENLALSNNPSTSVLDSEIKPVVVEVDVTGQDQGKDQKDANAAQGQSVNQGSSRRSNRKPRGPRNARHSANKATPRSTARKEKLTNDDENAINWWKAPWKNRIFTSGEYEGDWEKLRMGNRTTGTTLFPAPERVAPRRPDAKRDFRVVGFNRNTTEKEIYDTLVERGISQVNYVRKLLDDRGSWWSSARVSITQKDVEQFLKPDFWEPWICVVPWVWQGQRGPNGELEEGGLNDEYDEY